MRLVIVVVSRFDLLRQSVQEKLRVIFDEHEGFCLGEPPAGCQNCRSCAVSRKQRRILLQGVLRRRKALGMNILQHSEKQEFLGVKKLVERTFGDSDSICQLLHSGLSHPNGNAAAPRFADQIPANQSILFVCKSHGPHLV